MCHGRKQQMIVQGDEINTEPFSPGFVSGIAPEGDDDESGGHDRGDGRGVEGDVLQGPEVLEHGRLFWVCPGSFPGGDMVMAHSRGVSWA